MSATRLRLATACLVSLLAATTDHAQSLGDIAKKNQQQRDKAKSPPAKTYTNQDLTTDPTAPKTTPVPAGQPGKQFMTLYDSRGVMSSGGAVSTFTMSGRGHAGTVEDRRRAGITSEPDEVVDVTVADARDPVLRSCTRLLVAEVFMEHVVQISGIGTFEPRSPGDRPRPASLRLNTLSECKAVPRR